MFAAHWKASAGKREARLHPDMPKLIHAISRNKSKFKSVPEGPVGLLLALDPKHTHLAEVAERACGGNKGLCSFIVSCQEDEKTLRSLLAGIKSPVSAQNSLVQNLQVHVRKQEARFNPDRLATDEPLLIDVVTTKSDAVFNLVCDQFKGAKTLLFNVCPLIASLPDVATTFAAHVKSPHQHRWFTIGFGTREEGSFRQVQSSQRPGVHDGQARRLIACVFRCRQGLSERQAGHGGDRIVEGKGDGLF